jgi:hypothetical protein
MLWKVYLNSPMQNSGGNLEALVSIVYPADWSNLSQEPDLSQVEFVPMLGIVSPELYETLQGDERFEITSAEEYDPI